MCIHRIFNIKRSHTVISTKILQERLILFWYKVKEYKILITYYYQFYLLFCRHGVMIIGEPMSGKTKVN